MNTLHQNLPMPLTDVSLKRSPKTRNMTMKKAKTSQIHSVHRRMSTKLLPNCIRVPFDGASDHSVTRDGGASASL